MEIFSLKRITIALLAATSFFIMFALLSPIISGRSTNPCSPCHFRYYQYLDILEEEPTNQIPLTIDINETKTVSVAIQNIVNIERYSTLSNVRITLSSSNDHFSVSSSTVALGNMPPSTRTAEWQVKGTSEGFDYLKISATAYNTHERTTFSDSYQPYPLITIGNPTETPPPTSTPTPTATPTPTPILTTPPTSTPTPTATPTPTPTPTTPPTFTPTTTPTPTSSPSQNATEAPEHPVLPIAVTSISAVAVGTALFKWKKNGKTKNQYSRLYNSLPKEAD